MDSVGRIDPEVGDQAEQDAGARTRKRDSLFMSARMTLAGVAGTHEVRVRNLSAGGLMAEYDGAVTPGTAVTLEMRGLGEMTGSIAWCTHGRLGIAFDYPIDPTRARKPVGNGTGTPAYAKPLVISARRR